MCRASWHITFGASVPLGFPTSEGCSDTTTKPTWLQTCSRNPDSPAPGQPSQEWITQPCLTRSSCQKNSVTAWHLWKPDMMAAPKSTKWNKTCHEKFLHWSYSVTMNQVSMHKQLICLSFKKSTPLLFWLVCQWCCHQSKWPVLKNNVFVMSRGRCCSHWINDAVNKASDPFYYILEYRQ